MTKKETIIKAATELFIEKGYRETTTSDIRIKANVAQGTLFYHFKNKEGILLHIFADIISSHSEEIQKFSHKKMSGLEALIEYTALCDRLRRKKGRTLFFILPNFVPSLLHHNDKTRTLFYEFFNISISLIESMIIKGMEDGSIRTVNSNEAAHLLFSLFIGINRHMTIPEKNCPDLSAISLDFIRLSFQA